MSAPDDGMTAAERVDYWGAQAESSPERSPVAFGLLAVADALLAVADALQVRPAPVKPLDVGVPPPKADGHDVCECGHQRSQHHGNVHQCRVRACDCDRFVWALE